MQALVKASLLQRVRPQARGRLRFVVVYQPRVGNQGFRALGFMVFEMKRV